MTVNKLSLHMTINTIQQLSQLTSTTINTSSYRYKTGDTCIQKLYKVINDCIDIMSVCYNLNVCTNYDFLLPVCIIGTYIHKCFWFAYVSSLASKVCAHAHTQTHAHTHTRTYTTVTLIWQFCKFFCNRQIRVTAN